MDEALDKFGKFVMTKLRDPAIKMTDGLLQSRWKAPSVRALQIELSKLTPKQKELVRRCVIESIDAAKKVARGLPAYPIPAALIGRLATDERVRGQGYGARLLRDALTRIVLVSQQLACFGIVVDAKDAEAVRFCEKFGFASLGADAFPRRMFLATKNVLKSMNEA